MPKFGTSNPPFVGRVVMLVGSDQLDLVGGWRKFQQKKGELLVPKKNQPGPPDGSIPDMSGTADGSILLPSILGSLLGLGCCCLACLCGRSGRSGRRKARYKKVKWKALWFQPCSIQMDLLCPYRSSTFCWGCLRQWNQLLYQTAFWVAPMVMIWAQVKVDVRPGWIFFGHCDGWLTL